MVTSSPIFTSDGVISRSLIAKAGAGDAEISKLFGTASNVPDRSAMLTEQIPARDIMCYVLIGYKDNPKEDLRRVETLRQMGISPFVMPYDKTDHYQRRFARWVNHKAIFKSVKWEDYR